jgi:hypothetical protein
MIILYYVIFCLMDDLLENVKYILKKIYEYFERRESLKIANTFYTFYLYINIQQ